MTPHESYLWDRGWARLTGRTYLRDVHAEGWVLVIQPVEEVRGVTRNGVPVVAGWHWSVVLNGSRVEAGLATTMLQACASAEHWWEAHGQKEVMRWRRVQSSAF